MPWCCIFLGAFSEGPAFSLCRSFVEIHAHSNSQRCAYTTLLEFTLNRFIGVTGVIDCMHPVTWCPTASPSRVSSFPLCQSHFTKQSIFGHQSCLASIVFFLRLHLHHNHEFDFPHLSNSHFCFLSCPPRFPAPFRHLVRSNLLLIHNSACSFMDLTAKINRLSSFN